MEIIAGVLEGKSRWIAKAISLVENEKESKKELLAGIFPHTGKALILGITGAPGSGKSTLTNALTKVIRQSGQRVGIIAVDPTSPFTGGALLGDRIRMQGHALDEGVFIRSMASRGQLGGLSRATKDAVKILDAAGFHVIIVETVGVGQSEADIMTVADTVLVVLTPGGGDFIQLIKAGVMELADIFVVNKADLSGLEKLVNELESMLDSSSFTGWRPPVVATLSLEDKGIDKLWAAVCDHQLFRKERELIKEERETKYSQEVLEIIQGEVRLKFSRFLTEDDEAREIIADVAAKKMDPYQAALRIINKVKLNSEGVFTPTEF